MAIIENSETKNNSGIVSLSNNTFFVSIVLAERKTADNSIKNQDTIIDYSSISRILAIPSTMPILLTNDNCSLK